MMENCTAASILMPGLIMRGRIPAIVLSPLLISANSVSFLLHHFFNRKEAVKFSQTPIILRNC